MFPEKGDGIWGHNLYRNGDSDRFTTHVGCPVLLGNKFIGNKFIGYKAQWNGAKCGLERMELFGIPNPKSTRVKKIRMQMTHIK